MELNKKDLRKLIVKNCTFKQAIKEINKKVRLHNDSVKDIRVCVFNSSDDGQSIADLILEIEYDGYEGTEYATSWIATISVNESNYENFDYWEFCQLTRDVFKTMKKNMIKELNSIGIDKINTEDYGV